MSKLIKNDLVDNVFEKTNLDRQIIQTVIDSFLEEAAEAIKKGDSIELRGFGIFDKKLRKGKKNARNPKTGEVVSVPSHYVANFKPGKAIKQALWDLKVEE